jgi:serine protease Do
MIRFANRHISCVLLFVFALAACTPAENNKPKVAPTNAAGPTQSAAVPTMELPSFVDLVKKEGPAVVNISTTRTVHENLDLQSIPKDDPFYEFFRRFMPPGSPREFQARSLGSGFIISQDGYILTNAHVVADTDEVTVRLTTKQEYKAKVIGADSRTDIALIKIDATGLPVVNIGDPSKLQVGEWVAAIGAPFGFENSVTSGIVSAKGRSLPEENYVPFIQTDVALNPGSSGGPLFNMRSEVVGINSQIYSQTGGYMGLSFAIPIDIAMDVVKQLRASGKVTRGFVGVQVQELTADLAASFGLKDSNGALISMVEQGGPAAKAGLLPGDVIRAFDGKPIQTSSDLSRLVAAIKPGTAVNVDIWRKGAPQTVKVTIGELLPEKPVVPHVENKQPGPAPNIAGLVLNDLTPEQRNRLKIEKGLLVRRATGAAAQAGIQPGDVVLAFNDTPTTTVANFEAQLKRNAGKTIALLIKRGTDTLYLPLKLGTP